jgi:hypothetical protein
MLDELLTRVDIIEAKQSRPSPVALRTWEEIERFAEKAAQSGMVPKDFVGKPAAICIAIQMGSELGLAPMQALQSIAVINGRPSIWGDALPALCRASGLCVYIREWAEGSGDDLTYYCEARRKDDPNPIRGSFSVADAKQAGLWRDKPTVTKRSRDGGTYETDSGPWYSYRPRMQQMRARGFCLRDAFPDVLKGLISVEEARDIPFEETGLTPAPVSAHWESVGRETNVIATAGRGATLQPGTASEPSPPPPAPSPKGKTWAVLLDEIEANFARADSRAATDAVLASDDVQKALDKAKNGVRERLDRVIAAAMERFPEAPTEASAEAPATEPPPAPEDELVDDPLDEANVADILEAIKTINLAHALKAKDGTNKAFAEARALLSDVGRARVDAALTDRLAVLRPAG